MARGPAALAGCKGWVTMSDWTLRDLEAWDERIQARVAELGLDCYPQEFEVCDQNAMLGYMAYHGMPSHYPHWSFGKAFEQTKTMYDHGVSGLPYEMVINSDPCLAYLMRDNSLCLQVLTIAHVYGHNDFFKNNFTFSSATDAKETLASFKARADRMRRYIEDPSIGSDAVEQFLDAAHAISFSRRRNQAIKKLSREQQKARLLDAARPPHDQWSGLRKREEAKPVDLSREPLEPEDDILLFIRDHNREPGRLAARRAHDRRRGGRLLPAADRDQDHERGLGQPLAPPDHDELDLPQELVLEFLVRHNQVICPHPGGLNPYHVGFMIWRDIEKRFGGEGSKEALGKLMEVRESDRDIAFLRRFLTQELMRELDLFTWKTRGEHIVVDEVSDEEHWEDVKSGPAAPGRQRLLPADPHPRRQLPRPPRPLPRPRA